MRRALPALLLAALLAAPVVTAAAKARDIGRHSTLAQVDAAIRKVAPVGGDVDPALAYLRANHVEHSDTPGTRTVYAIVRNIRGGSILSLVEKSASIRILYDEQRHVTEVDVHADYTSL
ncbi:hypothetical protein [Caulobacter sp. UNC358MFTsu5.1]|uniref:hypothetical protein n=1 Tax=Caulobacter sp. UNC358MFTsu5.1 TaxID=1449049 RepID=UPI0004A6FC02|nr:hypothetical protein [Caulobacter sp. UNC358MFTsu5.1]